LRRIFVWRQLVGVIVDFKEGIVNDNAGPSVPLWDDTHRRDAHQLVDLDVLLDTSDWKNCPMPLVDEMDKFALEEVGVLSWDDLWGPRASAVKSSGSVAEVTS
jgi:hypothetical protein